MNDAGRVIILPKGEYVAATTYSPLDAVIYNGNTYVAIKETTGNLPTDETYWKIFIKGATLMQGATADADGAAGYIPKPLIADKDKFFKGDGTWAETGVSNPNLIDNGWFNVNSRGFTEKKDTEQMSMYCLDRWWIPSWETNLKVTNNGILISNAEDSGNSAYVEQKVTNGIKYPCTISVLLSNGTIYSVTRNSINNNVKICDGLFLSIGTILCAFRVGAGYSFEIKAVKLENGTVSTLHLDSAPDPELEKLRCVTSTADPLDTFANKTLQNPTGDEWSPTKTYNVGDMFIAGNQLWKTKVQHSGVIPAEGEYVTKTSVSEELKDANPLAAFYYASDILDTLINDINNNHPFVFGYSEILSNMGVGYFCGVISMKSSGHIYQLAIGDNGNAAIRAYNASSWSDWKKINS